MVIRVNHASAVPKYQQIINSVRKGLESRSLQDNQQLPSINELSLWYNISRDTVEKAYKKLKEQGVILSVPGKGYYTRCTALPSHKKILLLFNKLSEYKRGLYEGFVSQVKEQDCVDLKIYHEEVDLFEQLLIRHRDEYTDFVIIPAFRGEAEIRAREIIRKQLAGRQVWWLSARLQGIDGVKGAVFQHFQKDIYRALQQAAPFLSRYREFNLIFPSAACYPVEIIQGFQAFCQEKQIPHNVLFNSFTAHTAREKAAYLVLKEDHLVALVKKIKESGLRAGKNVGILAYNDSPLKEVLLDGISVVSTDHSQMGELAAGLVLENREAIIENRFEFIPRKSL